MKFEWDEAKRQSNLKKHGLDFARSEEVFLGPIYRYVDDRNDYGEKRFTVVGLLGGNLVAIVITERAETIRIISMRPANRQENRQYEKEIFG
jgi:uncharacterized protein